MRPAISGATARGQRGAVIILAALLIVVLFIAAAVVIDLSFVRQDRQSNKSAADFAAAAGIRAVDNGTANVQPWKGICASLEFLLANHAELTPSSETFQNGDGSVAYTSNPCASTSSAPYIHSCVAGTPSTWGWYTGLADDGRIRIQIKAGYLMPDPLFAEDAGAHGGDDGLGGNGCDQLAVIVEEREDATFGQVVGATGYESVVRTVARLVLGTTGEVTAALLILERNDCLVLTLEGTSGAHVVIEGNGTDPGVIHADSLGNGGGCDASDVQNGNILQVNGNPPDPRIIAARSPIDGNPGQITTTALSGASGAVPTVASSPSPEEVCVQAQVADCGAPAPITGAMLQGRPLVGRARVDARYRVPIRQLRTTAASRIAWATPADLPAGWTAVACNAPGPFTAARVWIDCAGGPFNGNDKTFAASVDEVVVDGRIEVNGNGRTLHFVDLESLIVAGAVGGDGISLTGTNNRILLNDGALTDTDGDGFVCDQRALVAPSARSHVVVGAGRIVGEGGSGKVLRMCNTTVFMMDDTGSPGCPVPSVDGVAPYDNACAGTVRVAGNNKVDWTAPNVNDVSAPTPAQLNELEDLAFWTETSGLGSIEGNGGVLLAGIFFTPNANPFRVGGNGTYDIDDAQFITRKLQVAGGGTLTMRPQPQNSVQIPVLGGFGLVR